MFNTVRMRQLINTIFVGLQESQCTYNVILRCVRVTLRAMEKQEVLNITRVCILALVIRHAKRMRLISLLPVVCVAVPYFSH